MSEPTLTEFLLARIAEDEAGGMHFDWCGSVGADDHSCDCTGPARVRAECEAKRRIVELAQNAPEDQRSFQSPLIDVLLAHVAIYADHPDYRDEWRP